MVLEGLEGLEGLERLEGLEGVAQAEMVVGQLESRLAM